MENGAGKGKRRRRKAREGSNVMEEQDGEKRGTAVCSLPGEGSGRSSGFTRRPSKILEWCAQSGACVQQG